MFFLSEGQKSIPSNKVMSYPLPHLSVNERTRSSHYIRKRSALLIAGGRQRIMFVSRYNLPHPHKAL